MQDLRRLFSCIVRAFHKSGRGAPVCAPSNDKHSDLFLQTARQTPIYRQPTQPPKNPHETTLFSQNPLTNPDPLCIMLSSYKVEARSSRVERIKRCGTAVQKGRSPKRVSPPRAGRVGVQEKILHTVTEFCGALSGHKIQWIFMGAVRFAAPVFLPDPCTAFPPQIQK